MRYASGTIKTAEQHPSHVKEDTQRCDNGTDRQPKKSRSGRWTTEGPHALHSPFHLIPSTAIRARSSLVFVVVVVQNVVKRASSNTVLNAAVVANLEVFVVSEGVIDSLFAPN